MKRFAFLLFLVPQFCFASVDLVKVDKSENKLYLLDGDKIVKEYTVALGPAPKGHKTQEGDNKTPEGTYILDYKKDDSYFYRSMHINYPNEADIENAKMKGVNPGGLIMIHGVRDEWIKLPNQPQNWTNGCIALTNREIDEFLDLVEVGTKIHIEW